MECGSPLVAACPSCGSPNPPQSKFCGECGSALTIAAVTAPPAAEAGPRSTERRLVSVLFLDLVSFTTLSERRDAEDMRSLMDAYFETARTVIERHGGVVEKFIGDAVMAVWGTPVTHEDDAERAVRAGLELVDAVAALGASMDLPLQARGGVLTGEAATSQDSGNQGMVTGDMVNTASRLQSAAEPGQVFVGEATFRAASRAVAFEEVGALTLKGKDEPVRAWRALRVVAERQGHNRMAIEPPFVGRAEELRLLKDMLHATGREGKSRVVSVTGIGGIGKSRLAWELLKYVDGLAETIWWHHGRCPSYGEGITFWALGEMVRMRAGIAETDPPGVSRSKLAASVAEHVPDEDERHWLEPRLAFLLGLDERPAGGREELFAAWRTFFERISVGGHRRDGVRGPAVGRRRPARLHRVDARVVPEHADLHRHPVPSRARGPPAELGRGPTELPRPPSRSARRRDDGGARARHGAGRRRHGREPHRRAGRGHAAVRGGDDPDARRSRCAAPGRACLRARGRPRARSRCPRRCTP